MFLEYETWEKYRDKLAVKDFPKELQPIFSLLDNYQNTNDNKSNLTIDDLANLLVANAPKDKDYYLGVLETIKHLDASPDTTHALLTRVIANKYLNEISVTAHEAKEGRKDIADVLSLFDKFKQLEEQPEEEQDENLFASDDLEFLIENTLQKQGLRWRLNTLNQMLGSLRKGDFGFVFARPETGKTTFLASEVTYMAEQLPDDAGPILWINNEEQSEKVMLRCIQASTGCTLQQLYSDKQGYNKLYHKNTRGKVKILKDMSIVSKQQVESLCRRLKPSLIIFDQIDKIVGFDADREDLKLGAIYQWAREIAKQYAPVIAVCQADGTGEGQKWLTMSNVANAKTSKQAEADWILGIGKVNDAGYDSVRYLHLSKNKLTGDTDSVPEQRHGRREVLIRAEKALYEDIG